MHNLVVVDTVHRLTAVSPVYCRTYSELYSIAKKLAHRTMCSTKKQSNTSYSLIFLLLFDNNVMYFDDVSNAYRVYLHRYQQICVHGVSYSWDKRGGHTDKCTSSFTAFTSSSRDAVSTGPTPTPTAPGSLRVGETPGGVGVR